MEATYIMPTNLLLDKSILGLWTHSCPFSLKGSLENINSLEKVCNEAIIFTQQMGPQDSGNFEGLPLFDMYTRRIKSHINNQSHFVKPHANDESYHYHLNYSTTDNHTPMSHKITFLEQKKIPIEEPNNHLVVELEVMKNIVLGY